MTAPADPWADRAFLRDVQYQTDANLAARQSIYSYQYPHIDLQGRVIDLAAPAAGETVCDVGCGNGTYLAELARRGFVGRVLGVDLSLGMLAAARERLSPAGQTGVARSARTALSASSVGAKESSVADSSDADAPDADAPDADALDTDALDTDALDTDALDTDALDADSSATVGLLAGDAVALPLRDGTADLTLALHMLYHVPDPSQAIRELRRVTRPGGRVVIVLNGDDHLRELRAVVAEARGDDIWGQQERLRLDGGEALAMRYFPSVTRQDFVSELRIPDPGPIADYVRSMSGTRHGVDPERLVASVVSKFPAAPGAVFTVTTHTGCLICAV
jgi:SAM-dependent methyltransferase